MALSTAVRCGRLQSQTYQERQTPHAGSLIHAICRAYSVLSAQPRVTHNGPKGCADIAAAHLYVCTQYAVSLLQLAMALHRRVLSGMPEMRVHDADYMQTSRNGNAEQAISLELVAKICTNCARARHRHVLGFAQFRTQCLHAGAVQLYGQSVGCSLAYNVASLIRSMTFRL